MALAGSATLLLRVELPEPRAFRGELNSTSAITPVHLPAGAPLGSVLAREGDKVRRGETLALLDEAELGREIAALDLDIAGTEALRRCLVDPDFRAGDAVPEAGVATMAEMRLRCDAIRNEARAELVRLEARAAQLRSARAVVEARMSEDRTDPHDATPQARGIVSERLRPLPHAIIRQRGRRVPKPSIEPEGNRALAYALALHDIDAELSSVESYLVSARIASARRLVEEGEKVRDGIGSLRDARLRLSRHLASPRVVAPVNGVIQRRRPIAPGTRYQTTGVLFEIAAEATEDAVVVFRVSEDDAARLRVDDEIGVRLSGLLRGELAPGRITRISEATPQDVFGEGKDAQNTPPFGETWMLVEGTVAVDSASGRAGTAASFLAPGAAGSTAHVEVTLARSTLAGRFGNALDEAALFSSLRPRNGMLSEHPDDFEAR